MAELLDEVMDLPGLVTVCLSAMITHLTDYGLEHVFDLTKYFQSFSGRSHMLLNGNTLSSLEIYRNQTDYTTKGSLLWTLDRTKTKFGRRLLRNWVGRPLLDRQRLEERVQAVEEMVRGGDNPKLELLKLLLAKISYDLERGLIRIYYGKVCFGAGRVTWHLTHPRPPTVHSPGIARNPTDHAADIYHVRYGG